MMDFLTRRREGAILVLTMSQPATRNALTGNTAIQEFLAASHEIRQDASIRAVILTGSERVFSSGGNVKDMQRHLDGAANGAAVKDEYRHGIQQLTRALYYLEVPLIAAVNGAAIGAGLDLACMCDMRVAAENAKFAESFIRVGIVPGDGGAWLLPRVVGRSMAAEMAFTGDALSAAEALACGLVSRVVPEDALMDCAMALAQRVARNPSSILRMTKRLLREGDNGTLDSVLELSAAYQALAHQTPAHAEAVRAFIEKRPPRFLDE